MEIVYNRIWLNDNSSGILFIRYILDALDLGQCGWNIRRMFLYGNILIMNLKYSRYLSNSSTRGTLQILNTKTPVSAVRQNGKNNEAKKEKNANHLFNILFLFKHSIVYYIILWYAPSSINFPLLPNHVSHTQHPHRNTYTILVSLRIL